MARPEEIERILTIFQNAEKESADGLMLLTERIVLARLTKAKHKASELSIVASTMKQIAPPKDNPYFSEIARIEEIVSRQEEEMVAPLASAFRLVVNVLEKMGPEQHYDLIARLRTIPLKTRFRAPIDIQEL